jgi:hypothetical protein
MLGFSKGQRCWKAGRMHCFRSHVSDPMTGTLKPLMCDRSCTTYVPTQRSPAIEGAPLLEGRRLKIRRYPVLFSAEPAKPLPSKVRLQRAESNFSRPYSTTIRALPSCDPHRGAKSQRIFVLHFLHREISLNDIYQIILNMMKFSAYVMQMYFYTFAQDYRGAEEQPHHNRPALPLAADFAKASQL